MSRFWASAALSAGLLVAFVLGVLAANDLGGLA